MCQVQPGQTGGVGFGRRCPPGTVRYTHTFPIRPLTQGGVMNPIWVLAAAAPLAAASPTPAAGPAAADAAPSVRVVQPVQEYFTPVAAPEGGPREYTSLYTHIGTD